MLVATGSEVWVCVDAAAALSADGRAGTASSRCRAGTLFAAQGAEYRDGVLPPGVPTLSVEAATTFGWDRYADDSLGIDHFGASAPGDVVFARVRLHPGKCRGPSPGPAREALPLTRLQDLHDQQDQSPWLDNLKRGYITGGELARLTGDGIRGITSNPSIFQKAIEGNVDYDDQLRALVSEGTTVDETYWDLVTKDIRDALAILRPVFDQSDGIDGFVSVEVAPSLARDTDGTIAAARQLHETIAEPNLYVKIPGTAEGVPAIRQMISEGRSINVTLLFSLARYAEVIEAYLSGLEAYDGDLAPVSSVASFFVSRVDTEVDHRLEQIGSDEALALRGKAAVANAKLAYALFVERFSGPRWEALAARGAGAATPVGLHVDQEPGLCRHALHRRAHRPAHGQHHPRRHDRRLRGSWHRGPHGRPGCRRGRGRPRGAGCGRGRPRRCRPSPRR